MVGRSVGVAQPQTRQHMTNTKAQQPLLLAMVDCVVGSVDDCTLVLAEVVTPVVNVPVVFRIFVSIETEVLWKEASTIKVNTSYVTQSFQHQNAPALT